MGKSLIIRGADFSANGIKDYPVTWFMDNFKENWATSIGVKTARAFVPGNYTDVQGKTINCVKLKVAGAGTFTFMVANGVGGSATYSQARTIEFSSDEVDTTVVKTFDPIDVPQDGFIAWMTSTDTGNWYYGNVSTGGTGFYMNVGNGGDGTIKGFPNVDMNVSIGYMAE